MKRKIGGGITATKHSQTPPRLAFTRHPPLATGVRTKEKRPKRGVYSVRIYLPSDDDAYHAHSLFKAYIVTGTSSKVAGKYIISKIPHLIA